MKSHKIMTALFMTVLSAFSSFYIYAAAGSEPVAMLQSIANNMISQLKANKATLKTKPQIVYRLANRYVVPYADIGEMSRRVLPPKVWNDASSSQKSRFEKEFTTLLIRTYASALTSYKDQVVEFYPIRGGVSGSTVEVRSQITGSDSQPIQVTYRLLRSGGGWRLYDMSVEGVSMINSFRSQFADILANGNIEQLLTRMSSHNVGDRD
jgi:phospholipid transport system substrate-binding protein